MEGFSDALGISDTAYALLRDLIEQRLGLIYENGKRELLVDRLSQITAAQGMQSFLDYYYTLKYDDQAERYWTELADQLAVPETYFWRQPDHFDSLIRHIVPEHMQERSGQPLRIWSAACCTGEEPYSIVMALLEARLYDRLRVEVVGSDASAAMVARARRGVYGERAFRNLSNEWRDRYFTKHDLGWKISEDIISRVDFRVLNLIDEEEILRMPRMDVTFCRNVFIYFSDEAIRRAADLLSRCLRPGGHLFLGAAETLTRVNSNFLLTEVGNSLVYVNNR